LIRDKRRAVKQRSETNLGLLSWLAGSVRHDGLEKAPQPQNPPLIFRHPPDSMHRAGPASRRNPSSLRCGRSVL